MPALEAEIVQGHSGNQTSLDNLMRRGRDSCRGPLRGTLLAGPRCQTLLMLLDFFLIETHYHSNMVGGGAVSGLNCRVKEEVSVEILQNQ